MNIPSKLIVFVSKDGKVIEQVIVPIAKKGATKATKTSALGKYSIKKIGENSHTRCDAEKDFDKFMEVELDNKDLWISLGDDTSCTKYSTCMFVNFHCNTLDTLYPEKRFLMRINNVDLFELMKHFNIIDKSIVGYINTYKVTDTNDIKSGIVGIVAQDVGDKDYKVWKEIGDIIEDSNQKSSEDWIPGNIYITKNNKAVLYLGIIKNIARDSNKHEPESVCSVDFINGYEAFNDITRNSSSRYYTGYTLEDVGLPMILDITGEISSIEDTELVSEILIRNIKHTITYFGSTIGVLYEEAKGYLYRPINNFDIEDIDKFIETYVVSNLVENGQFVRKFSCFLKNIVFDRNTTIGAQVLNYCTGYAINRIARHKDNNMTFWKNNTSDVIYDRLDKDNVNYRLQGMINLDKELTKEEIIDIIEKLK